MDKTILAAIVAAPIAAVGAGVAGYQMGDQNEFQTAEVQQNDGYATVIASRPLTETYTISEPRRECSKVPVRETVKQEAPLGGTATYLIGGAILGGVVGNQFGDGRGRDIATAAGAALGGSLGYDQAKRGQKQKVVTRYVEQCHTVNHSRTATRNNGYEVTYEYDGQVYTTVMEQPPGTRFAVQPTPAGNEAGVTHVKGAA